MVRNDDRSDVPDYWSRAPVPWTPRRKRIVQCLGRAEGSADLGWLLDCCGEPTASGPVARGAREVRARRQLLEVDLPVLEGYGVVRWEGSDRVALAEPYVDPGDLDEPSRPPLWPFLAVAAVLAAVVALHASAVRPFALVPPLWYTAVAIAALIVLPAGYRLGEGG